MAQPVSPDQGVSRSRSFAYAPMPRMRAAFLGPGRRALERINTDAGDLAPVESGFMRGEMGRSAPVNQGLPTTLVLSIHPGGTGGGRAGVDWDKLE